MTEKDKIRAEVERLYKEWRFHSSIEGKYRCEVYKELLGFIDSLPDEKVSEDLEKAARYNQIRYIFDENVKETTIGELKYVGEGNFKDGAHWQKRNLWKDAQGDDLPEYEREVVVFTQNFPDDAGIMRVSIAHRPDPDGWDGKSITTGKVEHYTPKTYDKGGWNQPDVVYWLDVPLPEGVE